MNDMFKCFLYKKNKIGFVRTACFIICIVVFLGVCGTEIHHETCRTPYGAPASELFSSMSNTFSEMQAEPEQIKGEYFGICEADDRDYSDREESLKKLIYIFEFFAVGILLLLKRITTDTYRMQCYGNTSIIHYMHHKDGRKIDFFLRN